MKKPTTFKTGCLMTGSAARSNEENSYHDVPLPFQLTKDVELERIFLNHRIFNGLWGE